MGTKTKRNRYSDHSKDKSGNPKEYRADFRQHNIVEYKSPLDYLVTIFIRGVWVYLFLQIRYQPDGQHSDRRTLITLVTGKYPMKIDAPLENNTEISSKKSGKRDLLYNGR